MSVEQVEQINIAFKFAEIDDKPYSTEYEGWVSRLVKVLSQALEYYFDKPVHIHLKKEIDLINETEFNGLDAVIYILSPAFIFSSNIANEISAIEKAVLFDTNFLNSKIHKVLKGPVNINDLPVTISMGTFHYFYQQASTVDSSYETIFDWDNAPEVRHKYWESFTNLLYNLLKNLKHPKHQQFIPDNKQTIYLGNGDIGQLWNRTNLLGELIARGVKVLPDHDHSIEVKHLNDPIKFYLQKCDLAIHFPEEFLPLDIKKLQSLAELPGLKRLIWFDPESEKEIEKKKLYDELKLKIKNLDQVEVISSGLEELKEIVFATAKELEVQDLPSEVAERLKLYIIWSEHFREEKKAEIVALLREKEMELLFLKKEDVHAKRTRHYQYLKEADYCLVCYDGKNPEWAQANINEVKKSRGLNLDKKKSIKLGIVTDSKEGLTTLNGQLGGITVISALSASFKNDLNKYVDGK